MIIPVYRQICFLFLSTEDDVYDNLRASLLHSGKGRPRALPEGLPLNNKLLIQLAYLRDEGKKKASEVSNIYVDFSFIMYYYEKLTITVT